METKGIKESLELLEGVKLVGVSAKKVLKDGKVNLQDLPVAMEIFGQLGTITAAVQGADQIPSEAKDYSAEELQQIGAKALEIVAAFQAA